MFFLSLHLGHLVSRPLLQLVVSHRVVILQTIELIVDCRIDKISSPKIKSIISLASDEMTRSKVKRNVCFLSLRTISEVSHRLHSSLLVLGGRP